MFGVTSAAHAVSRSAKTSPGAARNNAIQCPMSVSSALHRRNPRIPNSPDHYLYPSAFSKHPNEMGLVCVKTRAEQEPELGIFGAAGGHATCIVRRSSRSTLRVFQPPLGASGP